LIFPQYIEKLKNECEKLEIAAKQFSENASKSYYQADQISTNRNNIA
jgi:hypothetical protein